MNTALPRRRLRKPRESLVHIDSILPAAYTLPLSLLTLCFRHKTIFQRKIQHPGVEFDCIFCAGEEHSLPLPTVWSGSDFHEHWVESSFDDVIVDQTENSFALVVFQ